MDRNIMREILLKVNKMGVGESIQVGDLAEQFSSISLSDFLSIISRLASRFYIRIDGKYAHECYTIEKYNRIIGLDREGLMDIDYIINDKLWSKVENCLNENGYNDFSIFSAVELAKEIMKKEFEKIINK